MPYVYKGATIRYRGGGGSSFCLAIFLFHKGDRKLNCFPSGQAVFPPCLLALLTVRSLVITVMKKITQIEDHFNIIYYNIYYSSFYLQSDELYYKMTYQH